MGLEKRLDRLKVEIEAFQKERRLALEVEAWQNLLQRKRKADQIDHRK